MFVKNRLRADAALCGLLICHFQVLRVRAQEIEIEAKLPTAIALDGDLFFQRVIVGADGVARMATGHEGSSAGAGERLIYSNTLGLHATNFPNSQPVSDDIATTAPNNCLLTRYRFKVLGKVLPSGTGGAYTVTYGLYTTCPLAAGSTNATRDLVRIPGTEGVIAFPDDSPRLIEHLAPAETPVSLPTNIYLSLRFNRSNCGTVVGAPAMVGYSSDIWDFPGFPCNGFLGGFPELPHASFWAEMFASDACPEAFVAYKSERPSGGGTIVPNTEQGVDDLRLIVDDCRMTAYEVAVRGTGSYTFDLRRNCEGPPIAGTERNFVVNASTVPLLQIARFNFEPPIGLDSDSLYFGFKVHSTGSVVHAGIKPVIGESIDEIYRVDDGVCHPVVPEPYVGSSIYGTVNLAITCAGTLPTGACCDPYLTECNEGSDSGKRCLSNVDCAAPGTCEAVCRVTTEANCPWPPPDSELRPRWKQGATCDPDPFGNNPCGVAACCHLRPNPSNPEILDHVCTNLTKNECEAQLKEPVAPEWQVGEYCGVGAQACTSYGCVNRNHYCKWGYCPFPYSCMPHDPFSDCCFKICASGPDGAFCCSTEWDALCCQLVEEFCPPPPPSNDQCAPESPNQDLNGALTIPVPGSMATSILRATTDPNEPGFCCNTGTGECVGGTNDGAKCVVGSDCDSGICTEREPDPGAQALGTVWFKFVPPAGVTTVGISTCTSNAPALDSVMQVFAATDHSSPLAACNSLVPIGCNDDYPNCGSTGRNSRLCLHDLNPGETYYIELAAKTPNRLGAYNVLISTSCTGFTQTCSPCPVGDVHFLDPPSGTVDARLPHKINAPNARLGIRVFQASGPPEADPACWSFCSTGVNDGDLAAVTETTPGTYRLELNKPLAAGSVAYLSYRDRNGLVSSGRFVAHPGNANGDGQANSSDILALIDHLNGVAELPWGLFSGDMDRSGMIHPADIITLIDLLNGNGFTAWNGTELPQAEGCP